MTSAARIAVVGPGAIGATIIAVLSEAGRIPLICGRSSFDPLTFVSDKATTVIPVSVLTDPGDIDGPVDVVFLAVKAVHIAATSGWLARLCGPETVICALQNGVEHEAAVLPLAPESTVVPSVVWFPAERTQAGEVRLRGEPRLTVAANAGGRAVAETLDGTACRVELTHDFTTVQWRKLCLVAVSALMVLTRRRAVIYQRTDVAALALAYALECLTVGRAEGAALLPALADEIVDQYRNLSDDHGASILFDAEAGAPTEWDAINGVIVRRARLHGLPTPISDVLVPLLAAASD
jgi:2-dehydropantoate 2-reductase